MTADDMYDVEPTAVALEGEQAKRRKVTVPVNVAAVVLLLLLLASGGLAAWLYFTQYRPDMQTNDAAVQAVTTAARDGMTALLSYKSETLDQNVSAAKSHLTGDFVNDYEKRIREVVAPAVKGKDLTSSAQVVGAAVSELQPDSALVMLFIDQTTTSKDRPDPSMWASTVLVSLTKADGNWLITGFNPI